VKKKNSIKEVPQSITPSQSSINDFPTNNSKSSVGGLLGMHKEAAKR
jgi:hypothetical protein